MNSVLFLVLSAVFSGVLGAGAYAYGVHIGRTKGVGPSYANEIGMSAIRCMLLFNEPYQPVVARMRVVLRKNGYSEREIDKIVRAFHLTMVQLGKIHD